MIFLFQLLLYCMLTRKHSSLYCVLCRALSNQLSWQTWYFHFSDRNQCLELLYRWIVCHIYINWLSIGPRVNIVNITFTVQYHLLFPDATSCIPCNNNINILVISLINYYISVDCQLHYFKLNIYSFHIKNSDEETIIAWIV